MSNRLSQAFAWHTRQRNAHARDEVIYTRPGNTGGSCSWVAEEGRSTFNVTAEDGTLTTVTTQDFIGTAADLVISGLPALPLRLDIITNGQGLDFEVIHPDGSQPWSWCDETRIDIRVHTQQVTPKATPNV